MRPRVVTLVSGEGWHVQDLDRAAHKLGIDLLPISFSRLTAALHPTGQTIAADGRDFGAMDAVLVRMMPPGSLEQVVFRMDVLNRLAATGLPVLNPPRAVEAAVDKYLSLSLLQQAGLPIPPSFATETAAEALDAFDRLGGDVVVKPLFGSEGRGLVRVTEREVARRVAQALERIGAVIYLQKAVRNPGYDLRAFVLDGAIVGAMRRFAAPGDWRTNVAVGGRPEACQLTAGHERLALQAAAAVGATLAGVDILDDLDQGSPVVLEVNAVPGWRALSRTTGIDVASAILTHLRSLVR